MSNEQCKRRKWIPKREVKPLLTARGLITDIDRGKMKGEWVNCKWARSKMNEMDGKLKDLTNFFLEVGRLILFLEILQIKKK